MGLYGNIIVFKEQIKRHILTTLVKTKSIKDLKTPKGSLFKGHLSQFNADHKHLVLERWIEECGEIFKINFLGQTLVVSAKHEFNAQVLKLRPHKFKRISKLKEIFGEMGISGVFTAEGDDWKRQRKLTAQALNVQKTKEYFPIIQEKALNLLEKFKTYSDKETVFDAQKEFMLLTIDITTAMAFGYEIDTINNKENDLQKHLEIIFPILNDRVSSPLPLWRYYKQKKDIQLIKSLATIEKLIYKFIDQGKKRMEENPALKDKPTNFLESILIENDNDRLTDAEIYGNVFTMLLAGEDTTSNSIAWATYYLAQHPNIVKKIREEANLIYANSNVVPSTELLSKLTYTDAVVQESMRIKPASPQLYMQAIEEQTIEGLLIPKGMKVILQNKSAQNNNKHFSNANEFKPERWLASGCPVNHQPEVIKTFGGGPRFCPGKSLAINELVLTISMLCKHFDFEMMVNPEEVEEGFAFTMHPKNLKLKLKHAN